MLFLSEQNRMLYILTKNSVSKKHIDIIINDLKQSGILDGELEQEEDDWTYLDQEADWLFSDVPPVERIKAIENLKKKKAQKKKKYQYQKKSRHLHISH